MAIRDKESRWLETVIYAVRILLLEFETTCWLQPSRSCRKTISGT